MEFKAGRRALWRDIPIVMREARGVHGVLIEREVDGELFVVPRLALDPLELLTRKRPQLEG